MGTIKHDYTSETELKSLLIRYKNMKLGLCSDESLNEIINNKIDEYIKTKDKSLKSEIISLSEQTCIDDNSRKKFGEIILLMIKNILKKPNFSGYTWQDDFYSDACYKVLKYAHNFDHSKISSISNQSVNAFAYISQIIHNSIIFIINKKTSEVNSNDEIIKVYNKEYGIVDNSDKSSTFIKIEEKEEVNEFISENVLEFIKNYEFDESKVYNFEYSKNQIISIDDYYELRDFLNNKKITLNLIKSKSK